MIFSLLQIGPAAAFAFVLAIVIGITIHEFSHALAGYIQGDMTAKNEGRLTLNPMSHLDPMGSIMLLLAGFGWGRPTPYNPYNLKNQKYGPLIVALFGPLSNLIGAIVSIGILIAIGNSLPPNNLLILFLTYLFLVNVMLMLFNLLPIPPLDGSQIVFTLLPPKYERVKMWLAKNGPMILFGLIIIDIVTDIGIFSWIFRGVLSVLFNMLP